MTPRICIYLDELTNAEIAALLNAEVVAFPKGRPVCSWGRLLEKDCCFIERLYVDPVHYEDDPTKMLGILEREAKKRGLQQRPLDQVTKVQLPYELAEVTIVRSGTKPFAELRGHVLYQVPSLLSGKFPMFFVEEGA